MIMDPGGAGIFVCGMIVFFFYLLEINIKFNTVYHLMATTIRTLNSRILNAAKLNDVGTTSQQ